MAQVSGVFEEKLQKSVLDSKVLMVGAGGIGCELLKNLVLTGSRDHQVKPQFINNYLSRLQGYSHH